MGLARLRLPEAGIDSMARDLESILGHVEVLKQADVGGVEAVTHAVPATLPLREDVPVTGLGPAGLEGSASRLGEFVKVPKIVE